LLLFENNKVQTEEEEEEEEEEFQVKWSFFFFFLPPGFSFWKNLKDMDLLKGRTPSIKSTTLQEYFASYALTLLVYRSVGF
jgi:hypothetical protein